MKLFSSYFILLLLCSCLFFSCAEEIQVSYAINGERGLVPSDIMPQPTDLYELIQFDNGNAAIVSDISSPRSSVESRKWILIKQGERIDLKKDSSVIHLSFAENGVYGLSLEVNGEQENSVTHWVNVTINRSSDLLEDINDDVEPALKQSDFSYDNSEDEEVVYNRSYDLIINAAIYAEDFEKLSLSINDRELEAEFDEAKGLITSTVNLEKGKNTFKLITDEFELEKTVTFTTVKPDDGKVAQKKTTPPPPKDPPKKDDGGGSKPPVKLEAASPIGYDLSKAEASCMTGSGMSSEYSFTITPSVDIELERMYIFTDVCGGLSLELKGKGLNSKDNVALTNGRNKISLIGLNPELSAGNTYTLKLKTVAGEANCAATSAPVIQTAKSSCKQIKKSSNSAITVDYKGKAAIFDLKYDYTK